MGRTCRVLVLVALVTGFVAGCGEGRPDFTPAKAFDSPGPEGYCKRVDASLEVHVANTGQLALAVSVRVDFPHGPSGSGMTGVIPENGVGTALVPIPTPIPQGDFSFTIRVDPDDDVPESNEDNNSAEGLCIT